MLNSNLIDQLKKDSLDVVIVYAGNPCQLAIAHVLGVPVIYFDQEGKNNSRAILRGKSLTENNDYSRFKGLTDETLVAANVPVNLDIPLSHCTLPQVSDPTFLKFHLTHL